MARRFSRNDWNWKLRCWAAFLTGTRFPKSSAKRGIPSRTCRREKKSKYSLSGRYDCKSRPASSSGLAFASSHPVYHTRCWGRAPGNPTLCFEKGFVSEVIMSEACFPTSKDFRIGRHLCVSLGGRLGLPSECSRTPLKNHRASPGELGLFFTPVQKGCF